MAFFDDVRGRVSHAGKSAVQKTKDFAETTRLNSAISETRRKINELYKVIGQEIFSTYQEKPLPEVADYISKIKEHNLQIRDYQEQIRRINAFVICPQCNTKAKEDAIFCAECGYKFPKNMAGQMNEFCPGCGSPVNSEMTFCNVCGKQIH